MDNNTIFPMTAEECLYLQEHQNDNQFDFYISLAVNALLLLTTASSEMLTASKCKSNSIFELLSGKNCESVSELDEKIDLEKS